MQQTWFGSLDNFRKGSIEIIKGKPEHYAMSNVFDVASRAEPYEKIVVGKNLKYVIETLRAEGSSPWFAASHDEFAVVLDGEIDVLFHQAVGWPARRRTDRRQRAARRPTVQASRWVMCGCAAATRRCCPRARLTASKR